MVNIDTLEVLVPIYNEEACIDELVKRLLALKNKMSSVKMSFIFVNDGSKDKSMDLLRKYTNKHDFVKVINFSRNFGHQMALTAGLDYSSADYVAIIDADLQDPPELIEKMYQKAKEGFQIVYGQRQARDNETFFKKVSASMFYRLMKKMTDVDIPVDTGDFRLISKDVVNAFNSMRERHRFIRGMVPWCGFKSTPLKYHRKKRYGGKTNYPLRKMLKFAKDAIFSFSDIPLRVATYFGFIVLSLGILIGLFMLYIKLFTSLSVPGITITILLIVIFSGIQIIILGVMGEYIGRIFEESKRRPLYIVKEMHNIELKK